MTYSTNIVSTGYITYIPVLIGCDGDDCNFQGYCDSSGKETFMMEDLDAGLYIILIPTYPFTFKYTVQVLCESDYDWQWGNDTFNATYDDYYMTSEDDWNNTYDYGTGYHWIAAGVSDNLEWANYPYSTRKYLCTDDDSTLSAQSAPSTNYDYEITVTCCSGSGANVDGYRPGCVSNVTYDEAKETCESYGYRLCTLSEMLSTTLDVGNSAGCGFSPAYNWVSTECDPSTSTTASPAYDPTFFPTYDPTIGATNDDYYMTSEDADYNNTYDYYMTSEDDSNDYTTTAGDDYNDYTTTDDGYDTSGDNVLCKTGLWNVLDGDWTVDADTCTITADEWTTRNLIWLGNDNGYSYESNYSDTNFAVLVLLSVPTNGGSAGLTFRMHNTADMYWVYLQGDYVKVERLGDSSNTYKENATVGNIETDTLYGLSVHVYDNGQTMDVHFGPDIMNLTLEGIDVGGLSGGGIGLRTSFNRATFNRLYYGSGNAWTTSSPSDSDSSDYMSSTSSSDSDSFDSSDWDSGASTTGMVYCVHFSLLYMPYDDGHRWRRELYGAYNQLFGNRNWPT